MGPRFILHEYVAIEQQGLGELVKRREILLAEIDMSLQDVVKEGTERESPSLFHFGHQTWVRSGFCLSVISLSANRSLFGFQKGPRRQYRLPGSSLRRLVISD